MTIAGKVWGSTQLQFSTPFFDIHRLHILPNAFCSHHKHQYKWNLFYCIKGKILIKVKKNSYDLVDTTPLGPGQFTTVAPNEVHWFETQEEYCECLEIYYPPSLSEDIIRDTVGGIATDIKTLPSSK